MSILTSDMSAIENTLETLFSEEGVVELRAISKSRNRINSGYFDGAHRDALISEAVNLNKSGSNVYVVMNPINSQLLGRYTNRMVKHAKTTTRDSEVVDRRWLLIDLDPVRPSETASTDDQLKASAATALAVVKFLDEQGWPRPVVAMSGNGYHLLYRIDLPNDNESSELVKGVLAGLGSRFDTDLVKVDRSVHNAARITKLYGTVSIKGDPTPTTPWRVSEIKSKPTTLQAVSKEQLKTLVSTSAREAPGSKRSALNEDLLSGLYQDVDMRRLKSALNAIPADDYETWIKVGMALKSLPGNRGLDIWLEWSSKSEKFNPGIINNKWNGFDTEHDNPVTLGTIYHYAKEHGWKYAQETKEGEQHSGQTAQKTEADDASSSASSVELRCAASIETKPIKWLWPGWLAAGKFIVLAGSPGTGKTTCAYNFAATITTGGLWPDGTKCAEVGDVLIWSGEDAADDTIVPRLLAAGANLKRVHIITGIKEGEGKRSFDPAQDLLQLQPIMREFKPKMLIVDSVVSAVSGDSHKNTETRRGLQPLVDLGETFGVSILGISHFTKNTSGRDPLDRVTGSLAFGALARIVLAAAKLGSNNRHGYERVIARVKSNIGHDGSGFGYRLSRATVSASLETVKVEWGGAIVGSAKDILSETPLNCAGSAREEAQDFLSSYLSEGPKPAKEVIRAAGEAGISEPTLRRAKKNIGVRSGKGEFNTNWEWRMPRRST